MSFTKLNYHFIWGTKNRESIITGQLEPELYAYIGGIINAVKGKIITIGGIENHIHILGSFPPTLCVSDIAGKIKSNSSKWVNETNFLKSKFHWQIKYGGFTVSETQLENLILYIKNQKEHHKRISWEDEYKWFLKNHHIEFHEKYLWE